jgi:hypothetical protein
MADLIVSVANCPLLGEQRTTLPGGGWILNRITLTISGLRVSILQRPELFDSKGADLYRKGEFQHTTDVIVHDLAPQGVGLAKKRVEDLCWLLEFMAMSQVAPFEWNYSGRVESRSTRGILLRHIPTLEMNDGREVREFIESVWTSYLRLKGARQLRVFFDYVVSAELRQPFEIKLAILFVALEHLVTTFARARHIKYDRHKFVRPPVWNAKKNRYVTRPYSFMELFDLMLKEVRMKKGFKRIRNLRNKITHSGLSGKRVSSLIRDYETIQAVCREYILRLFGYRGSYIGYRERKPLHLSSSS